MIKHKRHLTSDLSHLSIYPDDLSFISGYMGFASQQLSGQESLATENINHNPTPRVISVRPEIKHSLMPGLFLSIVVLRG